MLKCNGYGQSQMDGIFYPVTEVDVLMEEKDNDIQLLGDSLNGLNEQIAELKAENLNLYEASRKTIERQAEEIAKLIKTDEERLQTITAYYPIVDGLRKQIAAMKTTIEKYKAGLMEKETYCVGCSLPTDLAVKIGEINILACLIARKALKEPEVKG